MKAEPAYFGNRIGFLLPSHPPSGAIVRPRSVYKSDQLSIGRPHLLILNDIIGALSKLGPIEKRNLLISIALSYHAV